MTRFRLSSLAKDDLADIEGYVAENNPPAAERLIGSFFKRFHLLARNPEMGEARPDLGHELRIFSVGNYVIVFRHVVGGVEIARVISGYRDLPSLFEDT